MKSVTVDILHKMVKDIETINRLFAQLLDKQAFERVNWFRKNYMPNDYTLSFDENSRLVLLEKLR
jgi:hypothetical protein